jgi:hypothetical protein
VSIHATDMPKPTFRVFVFLRSTTPVTGWIHMRNKFSKY